ncbi:MAG: hypothetical protein KA974_08785, partial [Saprospiraceae bacterium]|nr:hypothetical protein [Saprospiraceae bacterium]
CIGLAAITRPIDILICIIPLCWQSTTIPKLTYWRTNYSYILLIIGVTFLTCLPQLLYWKFVSGQWIYFSYSINDYFSFNRFRVMHGLFSYRKGWFIYTPLALLAFCQMFSIRKESIFEGYKNVFWAFFIPMIYLVFSWHNWFYGWSFGCRALIGTLPLLAIPLALTLKHISESSKLKQVVMSSVLLFFVYLNLFQTWQFNNSILHGTLMNETTYWKVFLKTKKPSSVDKCHELQQEMDWNTGE